MILLTLRDIESYKQFFYNFKINKLIHNNLPLRFGY